MFKLNQKIHYIRDDGVIDTGTIDEIRTNKKETMYKVNFGNYLNYYVETKDIFTNKKNALKISKERKIKRAKQTLDSIKINLQTNKKNLIETEDELFNLQKYTRKKTI